MKKTNVDSRTILVYDKHSDSYSNRQLDAEAEHALQRFVARLVEDAVVLDLGCGDGLASAYMKDRCLCVDPIDASLEMVRIANERFEEFRESAPLILITNRCHIVAN